MNMSISWIRINPGRVIKIQLYLLMVIRLITDMFSFMSPLEFVLDINCIILLLFIIFEIIKRNRRITKPTRIVTLLISLMFVYDILRLMMTETNPVLFIWGCRNQYRFLIIFVSACVFWEKENIDKAFRTLKLWLMINMVVITVQFFIFDIGRDHLGGTFGFKDSNCNAITNIMICLLTTYHVLCFIYRKSTKIDLITVIGCSMYWAALAEIKVYFVELVLIIIIVFLFVQNKSSSKISMVLTALAFLFAGVVIIGIVFPEEIAGHTQFEILTNPKAMYWYLMHVHGGAHGFGRTTAISMTNSIFFNHDIIKMLFGIGLGNAEFLSDGFLNVLSDFYKEYNSYMYHGYFYAFIYIERGIIGLLWYFLIWLCGFRLCNKNSNRSQGDKIYNTLSKIFYIIVLLNAFKDSTLRISVSGYLSFLFLAVPFIIDKKRKVVEMLCA